MRVGESRVKNSLKNISYGIIGQVLTIFLNFLLRTIFISRLGTEYLGVNGLFTNIISVLSLTELGLGVSITYSMYGPLAKKDYTYLRVLISTFQKIYTIVGIAVFSLGMMLVPFVEHLIADTPDVGNLKFIYSFFILDTTATYFFAHYRSLITADQSEYINVRNRTVFKIVQIVLQIIILSLTQNYYLYLFIQIGCNILSNVSLYHIVKKKYKFLNEKPIRTLKKDELIDLLKFSTGVFSQRIGYTVLNSTDNIIISTFIGSMAVGIYSNYTLIITTIKQFIYVIVNSVQASVGNLVADSDIEKEIIVFKRLNFMYTWIYGFSSICLVVLLNPFISVWLGNDFLISESIIYIVVANFYINGVRQSVGTFITAKGLFWYLKIKPIIEVSINLSLSIILVQRWGLIGVFFATFIATISTSFWYEPYVLFKKGFNVEINSYFKKYSEYTLTTMLAFFLIKYVNGYILFHGYIGIIIKLLVCIVVYNLVFVVTFHRCEEFKYIQQLIKRHVKRIKP